MAFLKKTRSPKPYLGDPDEYRLTLVEHLEELRDRIIRALTLVVIGSVIGWFAFPYVYSFLNDMVNGAVRSSLPKGVTYSEAFFNSADAFLLKVKLSFQLGVVLSFPFLVLELWGFIAPALKPSEQVPFKKLGPISLILFLMGAAFCWVILPSAISFFISFSSDFQNVEIKQEAGKMVFFVLKMLLAFGISFQLPLVVYALGMLELLTAETLIKYWRQAATFIFIASAVITPSGDAFSMAMMAVPMVILFLISVYFVNLTQKKRRKEREAEEAEREELENRERRERDAELDRLNEEEVADMDNEGPTELRSE